MNTIIQVNHLSKQYFIGKDRPYLTLRDEMTNFFKNPFSMFRNNTQLFAALTDISFTLEKGESLGIIGANGAGKSTLLKILSRITAPTKGEVILHGRVASLLEVGTGFHPELTGRENIYLNGSMMGLTRKEITERFSSIVTFSGVEKFLDTPVKFYSTGMYTRLAFSIAAHLEPEILIVDEILSVGDLSFQKKSFDKMNEVGASGKTIIFVSHNMAAIAKLCKKVLWLDKGKIVAIGETNNIIEKYVAESGIKSERYRTFTDKKIYKQTIGWELFRFTSISIKIKEKTRQEIYCKEPFVIEIEGMAYQNLEDFSVGFGITMPTGLCIFNSYSVDNNLPTTYKKGKITFTIPIDPNPLIPGSYTIDLTAHGLGIAEWIPHALQLHVLDVSITKASRLNATGISIYSARWAYRE